MRKKSLWWLVLVLAMLIPLVVWAETKREKCLKACEMSVDYCTKACKDGAGGKPGADAECKKACDFAKKKCQEVCQKRY